MEVFTPREYAKIRFNNKVTGKTVRNWINSNRMPSNTRISVTPSGRYLIIEDSSVAESKAELLVEYLIKGMK